jgi:hypothetical protein
LRPRVKTGTTKWLLWEVLYGRTPADKSGKNGIILRAFLLNLGNAPQQVLTLRLDQTDIT